MDWTTAAVRFALYLDLTLLFGIPLFCLYALNRAERSSGVGKQLVTASGVAAALGIVLSLANMVVMARAMTGAESFAALQSHMFEMVVTGTDFGAAWVVRMAALLLCTIIAAITPASARLRIPLLMLAGAVALSTLAWGGHGAMHDGTLRYIHLASDIAHLLAAGAWVGALSAFVVLSRAATTQADVEQLSRTANGFARVGTIIVATLAVTGAVNYWMIAGPVLPELSAGSYGAWLLLKLALFAGMLLLAAANRFRLSPRIALAVRNGDHAVAVGALRRSLLTETLAATLILALVAWLGMLSPTGA